LILTPFSIHQRDRIKAVGGNYHINKDIECWLSQL
jgi:hypothetical protein